jgi:hypothetical protein
MAFQSTPVRPQSSAAAQLKVTNSGSTPAHHHLVLPGLSCLPMASSFSFGSALPYRPSQDGATHQPAAHQPASSAAMVRSEARISLIASGKSMWLQKLCTTFIRCCCAGLLRPAVGIPQLECCLAGYPTGQRKQHPLTSAQVQGGALLCTNGAR